MRILALDTATESCSAALLINGQLAGRELELGRGHAEHILPMIDELLAEAGTTLGTLDAIAFGRGPGGFTGVRLAASVTQGLAFGAGLPVIPVSDLAAVAQRAVGQGNEGNEGAEPHRVIVCNDARMREVYWACFERRAGLAILVGEERVAQPDAVALPSSWTSGPVLGAGRGFSAYPHLRTRLESRLAAVHERLLPRAQEIALLAVPVLQAGQAVTPEQALPVYLRDEVAQPAER
jgi:tRNA threonylcarbamoyladenosine biosynthesis protein TsaB